MGCTVSEAARQVDKLFSLELGDLILLCSLIQECNRLKITIATV